jgi:hypothetical protein
VHWFYTHYISFNNFTQSAQWQNTGWMNWVWFLRGERDFPLFQASRSALMPAQPQIQLVSGALSQVVKWLRASNLPLTSTKCQYQEWWSYTSTPPYVIMAWYLLKHPVMDRIFSPCEKNTVNMNRNIGNICQVTCIPASHLTGIKSYPCNRPWRLIGLWEVEASPSSRQPAHRLWWGCQPYATATL